MAGRPAALSFERAFPQLWVPRAGLSTVLRSRRLPLLDWAALEQKTRGVAQAIVDGEPGWLVPVRTAPHDEPAEAES